MPNVDGNYVSPVWADGAPPALDATELQAMTDAIADSYRKGEVMSEDARTLLGLEAGASPSAALLKLGRTGQYVWKRRTVTVSYIVDPSTVSKKTQILGKTSADNPQTIRYSGGINIDPSDGTVTLAEPVTEISVTYTDHSAAVDLRGKYFITGYRDGIVYFAEEGAATSSDRDGGSDYNVYIEAKEVSPIRQIVYSAWEYLRSSDRDAYPDSGTVDGTEYEFCGVPAENAEDPARVMTGSYIGNGLCGAENPNTLAFDAPPKLLFIMPKDDTAGNYGSFRMTALRGVTSAQTYFYNGDSSSPCRARMNWGENTVEWYAYSADVQLNAAGAEYLWAALR